MTAPFPIRVVPAFAERAWFTPPPLSARRRARWEQGLAGTTPLQLELDGELLGGFEIGTGPVVLLVHGWGGRAAQMASLGVAIADAGFHTVAVNAPGHGDTKPATTNVFEMAAAIDVARHRFGEPYAVVAHSLGAMAAVHAFGDAAPSRVVMIAPVLDVEEVLDIFSDRAGLVSWTRRSLHRRIRRFIGDHYDRFAAGARTELGESDVLIVHDPDDRDAPFATSASLAVLRPRTELVPATSLGHTRLLHDPEIGRLVAGFIRQVSVEK
jgi:pimeloyl-ACP methyl ester carboxylesterase